MKIVAYDLIRRRPFAFPTISSLWDDDEDWLSIPASQTGLSISEDEKNVYVEAAVPGIDPKNVDVTFHDGYVTIHGEVKEEEKEKDRKYYRQFAQSFSYRVAVPNDIDQNVEPTAHYKNGVMKVTFAKTPKSQPKKIKVKTA